MTRTTITRTAVDEIVVRYASWLLAHRWPALIVIIAAVLALAYAASSIQFKDNYRIYFGETNPQLQAFEEIQNVYTKDDSILFVVTPASGSVFDHQTLAMIEETTAKAWQLPFSMRVDSVTNFQHTTSEDDDLLVEDLVSDAFSLDETALDNARAVAVSDPVLRNRLINEQASVTAISVTLNLPEIDLDEVHVVVAAARALADEMHAAHPSVDIRLAGTTMMNNAFSESAINDISTLIPAMYLLIVVVMLILVRCAYATLATVVVILASIVAAIGFAALTGIKLSAPSASAPTVITTLAVADCIHLIVSTFTQMRRGLSKHDAIVDALRINMQPVFLTSATTAIGFLTLNFSDSPPFHDLGNIAAFGVMAAFVFAVTLLPVMLSLLPCKARGARDSSGRMMTRFADWVIGNSRRLLIGGGMVCLLLLAFVPRNELNDNPLKYFSTDLDFRQATDYTNDNLTGTSVFHFSLPAGADNSVSDPQYLQTLDAFANWYREHPSVMHVSTISDIFKRLNKNLHGDDESYYRLPDDSALAAQYLFLYELSLPQGLDLTNQINLDKSASRFTVTGESLSGNELQALVAEGEQWLRDNAPQMYTQGVGVSVMFSYIAARNMKSMLGGTLAGLVLISGILIVALRDVRLGLLSLIPNLLPIGLTFGIWGMLVGQVNLAASIVASMVLGIVVDDTVHFLSKYLRARREANLSAVDAVRYAFQTVGMALLITTFILTAGFALLAQSDFGINSIMATLTAIAIAVALIVDFLLLPGILIYLDRGHDDAAATDTEITNEKLLTAG